MPWRAPSGSSAVLQRGKTQPPHGRTLRCRRMRHTKRGLDDPLEYHSNISQPFIGRPIRSGYSRRTSRDRRSGERSSPLALSMIPRTRVPDDTCMYIYTCISRATRVKNSNALRNLSQTLARRKSGDSTRLGKHLAPIVPLLTSSKVKLKVGEASEVELGEPGAEHRSLHLLLPLPEG